MIKALADRINQMTPDKIAKVFLEDIALCAAWLDSQSENTALLAGYQTLRENFDHWTRTASPPDFNSEGGRQQPILRKLVTGLLQGKLEALQRDELDVLYFAWGLAKRAENKGLFDRTMQLIEKHMDTIRVQREAMPKQPDLPNVTARVAIYSCEELAAAPAHDAKSFAGLDIPIRGPILMHKGDLKIIDSIPEDCTVVADGGECYVNGPVFGKLAATNACEILGNVSGVIVARRGHVRTAKLLNHAIVISKEGSVSCTEAQSPGMVYGGNEVKIRDTAQGGEYLGRRVVFGQSIKAGVVQITESVTSPSFLKGENKSLHIVLRKNLSCQDYGEKMSLAATRLMGSAIRYRQHIRGMQDLLAMTNRESEDYAMNLLLFLLGADGGKNQIQNLQALQVRASYAERIEAVAQALLGVIELRLGDQNSEGELYDDKAGAAEVRGILEDMERDLATLASEAKIEVDLANHRDEIIGLGRKIQGRGASVDALMRVLTQIIARLDSLAEKRTEATAAAAALEKHIDQSAGRNAVLDKVRARGSCIEMLGKLMEAGRGRGASEAFRRRVADRQVKLMLRNIEHRRSRVTSYENSIKMAGQQIHQVRDKLWREYQVSLPPYVLEGEDQSGARAEGAFGAGIVLCAWKHLVESGKPGERGLVVSEDSQGQSVRYARSNNGAIILTAPTA